MKKTLILAPNSTKHLNTLVFQSTCFYTHDTGSSYSYSNNKNKKSSSNNNNIPTKSTCIIGHTLIKDRVLTQICPFHCSRKVLLARMDRRNPPNQSSRLVSSVLSKIALAVSPSARHIQATRHSRVSSLIPNINDDESRTNATKAYRQIPPTAPYEYAPHGSYSHQLTSPVESQQPAYQPAPSAGIEQVGIFTADDPASMAQLQRYAPLQPTRNLSDQPTTTREGMVYPDVPANTGFLKSEDTGPGISPPILYACDAPYLESYIRSGMMHIVPSSSRYDPQHGYLAHDGMGADHLDHYGLVSHGTNVEAVLPNHKAPPAKRGPFKDKEQRQQTAHVRKIGSCVRCKMQRIRVSLNTHGLCEKHEANMITV